MLHQPTSIAAFQTEVNTWRLSQNQTTVLKWIEAFLKDGRAQSCTSAELLHRHNVRNVNLMRARFTELADLGAIVCDGIRACEVTGRKAMTWRIAAKPWTPRPKTVSVQKRLDAAVILLRQCVNGVRAGDLVTKQIRTFLEGEAF